MHNQALDKRWHQDNSPPRKQAIRLIEDAIRNKYANLSRAAFSRIFDQAWNRGMKAPDESALAGQLRIADGAEADVANQVILLLLIDRFWAPDAALARPLQTIHSMLFGLNGANDFRTEIEVKDFDDELRTKVEEVRIRLDEIESLAWTFTSYLRNAGMEIQAMFLAHVFASAIRIHPFPDGNGRTARLFVQYALRCWRLPFLPIPKVRNDLGWKQALATAIDGDAGPLAEQFQVRMMAGFGHGATVGGGPDERVANISVINPDSWKKERAAG
uniref:Fic/DOC family protein n=1 Tax=Candidatus Kentrum sp. DK TaxID=2126562 RepID=A0A450TGL0_9GAMM|nr:MAG: Fic/DOC family protein [Candidatus Kentron sp. DK]